MVQRFAENDEDTDDTRKAQGIAEDGSTQDRNIAERVNFLTREYQPGPLLVAPGGRRAIAVAPPATEQACH